jgi:hypothetical protein
MPFKSRASFTGSTSDGKNAKFLAMNHELISRDLGGKKALAYKFTILRPLSAGFSSAPYKLKSTARIPDAKPLSELRYSADGQPVMTMWAFKKQGSPGNKGPRSELCWTLQAGNTIKLWLDEERIKDDELVGAGEIPPFTVCEISVASKNEDSVQNGWCLKITTVRPAAFSLHSMTADLRCLSGSAGEARAREMAAVAEQPCLQKELETQSVAFATRVRKEAQLDEAGTTLKLVNLGDLPHVEITADQLMSATNCRRMDWACALLEVAIAAGAVTLVVVANDFWKGGPRAVPIIDAEALLGHYQGPGTYRAPFTMDVDGNEAQIDVVIGEERVAVQGAKLPACDDFELAGPDTELSAAYSVQFNLWSDEHTCVPGIWKGYFNAGPTRSLPVLAKRKRFQTMDF